MSERASKGTFLKPEKLQNQSNEGKGKDTKKKGGEKKAMVALIVFIIATLEIVFGRKKLLDAKGLFSDNVIKNPAIYTCILNTAMPVFKRKLSGHLLAKSKRYICKIV